MRQVDSSIRSGSTLGPCDEELVARARQGRLAAYDEIFRRYRGLVESKARLYYLAGADHEDVIQEGMIGLYKAVRDFSGMRTHAFRTFADLCVTRQIITAVKAASRQKHLALNSYVSMDAPGVAHEPDQSLGDILPEQNSINPEEVVAHRQLYEQVTWHLAHDLSAFESQALRLYLQGRSYSEIAGDLQCNIKQIDNALQRAKRKISRRLWMGVWAG
ncbi:MAG: RNA polymerase sporulation sigma factor SigH [Candidatus Zipacnadales bacterium]